MKIKEGLILRNIADSFIVLPSEGDFNLDGIISLNESGAFLFNLLKEEQTEESLINALLKEYRVDKETAKKDVGLFLKKLRGANLVW